ncbi:hypothetical protein [Candidatus Bandiella numerosa]|uniref:hypothetical protein n=1 Tax=Candidatus Bandiella numerosa TaxID=2570586 RepID=UPI001F1F3AEF|nr:hypothetical protein [Candidatus Bandiella numerosa]
MLYLFSNANFLNPFIAYLPCFAFMQRPLVVNKAKYIGKNFNEFSICSAGSYKELGTIAKKDLAKNLVDKLEKLLG